MLSEVYVTLPVRTSRPVLMEKVFRLDDELED